MRLPKPIYEGLPFFLVAIGVLFIALVLRGYEYAPTLWIWLLGMFCVLAGAALLVIRVLYRRQHSADKQSTDWQ